MRFILAIGLIARFAVPGWAQSLPDHALFDQVLEKHLNGRFLDYAAVKTDPSGLDAYLTELRNTDAGAVANASSAEQLAFWINAYNACAIKLVVEHYPIQKASFPSSLVNSLRGVPANSIRQIPNTWKQEFCAVAGKDRALDEIEHEIIRPMGDPRIHFAVNCASRSCPVLASDAYTSDLLDEQLDAAVARFVADPHQYRLERSEPATVYLNKVLDWYKDDFGGDEGVLRFLLSYLPEGDAAYIREHGPAKIKHPDYDWTLNDTAVFSAQRP